MPQLAIAYIGAEVGAYVLGTEVVALGLTGAQIGFAIGSFAASYALSPTQKSQGPRLADLKAPQVTAGSIIPWVEGHPRLGGVIVWASDKREIANTTSVGGGGKGGGAEQTTFTYEQDILILLSENINWVTLRRVWSNGKLIYTRADDSDPSSTARESDQWARITLYDGNAAQLPDPTYEAAVGAANAPAYRTRCSLFIESLKLGTSGQLPNLTFEGSAQAPGSRVYYGGISLATPQSHAARWGDGVFELLDDAGSVSSSVLVMRTDGTAYGYTWDGTDFRMATWAPDGTLTVRSELSSFISGVSRDGQVWALQGDVNPGGVPDNGIMDHGVFRAVPDYVMGQLSANGQWLTAWTGGIGTGGAYLFDVATLTPTYLGDFLIPGAVSDDGRLVVVQARTESPDFGLAQLWTPGGIITVATSVDAAVTALSPDGQFACGFTDVSGTFTDYRPFLWQPGTGAVLMTALGTGNTPAGISDDGPVVVGSNDASDAIVWRAGVPSVLSADAAALAVAST